MQFDDKFTVQIFRFKHIVTGIEHEPSKEEVLEQTYSQSMSRVTA